MKFVTFPGSAKPLLTRACPATAVRKYSRYTKPVALAHELFTLGIVIKVVGSPFSCRSEKQSDLIIQRGLLMPRRVSARAPATNMRRPVRYGRLHPNREGSSRPA